MRPTLFFFTEPRNRSSVQLLVNKEFFIDPASTWKQRILHRSSFYLETKNSSSIQLLLGHKEFFIDPVSTWKQRILHRSSLHLEGIFINHFHLSSTFIN